MRKSRRQDSSRPSTASSNTATHQAETLPVSRRDLPCHAPYKCAWELPTKYCCGSAHWCPIIPIQKEELHYRLWELFFLSKLTFSSHKDSCTFSTNTWNSVSLDLCSILKSVIFSEKNRNNRVSLVRTLQSMIQEEGTSHFLLTLR